MTIKTFQSLLLNKKALRFALTGLLITAIHIATTTAWLHFIYPASSIANGVAFVTATIISYVINTKWSFSAKLHKTNLYRFSIVSCVGLILAVTISGTAQHYGLQNALGTFFVVCAVPPVTFILHNFWTYR